MSCPYSIWVHHESRANQRSSNLFRSIHERHRRARRVRHLGEHMCARDAGGFQEATGGVGGNREHNPIRLVGRSIGYRDPPAIAGARQAGNTLADPQRPHELPAERVDRLTHSGGEAAEARRHVCAFRVDAEYSRGTAFLDGGELFPGPHRRPAGALIHYLIPDPQLPSELGQLRFARKKAVRPAFDDESLRVLGDDHAARPALALVHGDLTALGPGELPCRRESRQPCADDGDLHSQPRSEAAVRTTSATAATSPASSLSEAVRSSCRPSRRATAWYSTSMS